MMSEKMTWSAEARRGEDVGLIVLEEDPVSGPAVQRFLPELNVQVARVSAPPAAGDVSAMAAFEAHLSAAAASLLPSSKLAVIGFACTTGAIQMGEARLATAIAKGASGARCVHPIRAAVAAFRQLDAHRLAIVSPYQLSLSTIVADALGVEGFSIERLCYFDASDDAITSISATSVIEAARRAAQGKMDGLFLSCTGMRSIELIEALEDEVGVPVLSSIQVMAWQMAAEMGTNASGPGTLLRGRQRCV